MFDPHKLTDISPAWWGAIASAAAAGAMLFPNHRFMGGASLAAAMLGLALYKLTPCPCTAGTAATA